MEHRLLSALPLEFVKIDPAALSIPGAQMVERRLSDMQGYFADEAAYREILAQHDPIIYQVYAVEPAAGEGALHYSVGVLMPGRIGDEYYLTKGHLHEWRAAAEVYIGLRGNGVMLLEAEDGGETNMIPLLPNSVVYVPGHTAHRTINTGDEPLTYIGVYPAQAGHDYGPLAERNFRKVVIAVNGQPTLTDRDMV